MRTEVEKAIKNLVEKIDEGVDSADALRYTQAALNLAHLQLNLNGAEKNSKKS